jgi:hypothetical protein
MPWHLVDTWWDIGQETPFESLAVDVTISDDLSSTVNLYIAPIGIGHLSKTPFYGGIQTQADGYTKRLSGKPPRRLKPAATWPKTEVFVAAGFSLRPFRIASKKDQKLRTIGPGFLFSMWGERSHDAIRPADGGFFQSSGHEGDFVSVRRPFAWKKGKYTYRLTRMDQEMIDGKPFTWVGAFVYSHEKDENVFVGALRFKGEKLVLARKVANFVEVYGRRRPVADIPKVTVTFGPPVVNGKAPKNPTAEAIYPKGVPDYADTVAKEGSLVVTVGTPVEGREKRRVKLIEGEK